MNLLIKDVENDSQSESGLFWLQMYNQCVTAPSILIFVEDRIFRFENLMTRRVISYTLSWKVNNQGQHT